MRETTIVARATPAIPRSSAPICMAHILSPRVSTLSITCVARFPCSIGVLRAECLRRGPGRRCHVVWLFLVPQASSCRLLVARGSFNVNAHACRLCSACGVLLCKWSGGRQHLAKLSPFCGVLLRKGSGGRQQLATLSLCQRVYAASQAAKY